MRPWLISSLDLAHQARVMRLWLIPVLALALMAGGCNRDDQQFSGTITLTNELYDGDPYYYALGLSFDEAKAVPTLPDQYRADITLMAGTIPGGTTVEPFLSANTLEPAFALKGEYATESDAVTAFRALKDVSSLLWEFSFLDLAAPLKKNQVWVVRTRDHTYAKLRIIDVVLNTTVNPPLASCKLEWVWQPDGTATFP
ncbi:MAG: hypothetical protein P1P83_07385 [Bacteroidales bacterium]|nr:hypothetical protein [Bacteroidales bacterium]MDT8373786.1 hypothetical protein [Bacteroidales bacterium]